MPDIHRDTFPAILVSVPGTTVADEMSVMDGREMSVAVPGGHVDARLRVGEVVSIDGNAGGIKIVAGNYAPVLVGRARDQGRRETHHERAGLSPVGGWGRRRTSTTAIHEIVAIFSTLI